MKWGLIDIREEFARYEREHRFWPRSGSVSKPFKHRPITYQEKVEKEREEFERWHQYGLILEDHDGRFNLFGLGETEK